MKTLMISEDSSMLQQVQQKLRQQSDYLNDVLNACNGIENLSIKSIDELTGIIKDPSKIHEILTAEVETPTFLGYKMKRKEFLDKLELPDLTQVENAINQNPIEIFNYTPFSIVGGKVAVSKKAQEEKENRAARMFTQDDLEVEVLTKYQAAGAALGEFLKAIQKANMRNYVNTSPLDKAHNEKLTDMFTIINDEVSKDNQFLSDLVHRYRNNLAKEG